MPETRKPARYKAAHRKPAWLYNSSPAKHLIRILDLIVASTLVLTRQGATVARNGFRRLRHATQNAYRYLAPRAADNLTRLRDSRWGSATVTVAQRTAVSARGYLATARNSAVAQATVHRVHQSVSAARDSRVGQLTRQGLTSAKSTAKRHLPDWALTRIRQSRSAWSTAVADNGSTFLWRAAAGVAIVAIAAVMLIGSPMSSGSQSPSAAGVPAERSVEDEANRAQDRAAEPEAPEPGDAETAEPAPETEEAPEATEEPPAEPEPVGGLNADQMANAVEIVRIGEDMGISERGQAVALVTAMQESQLLVLANTGIPESLDVPNQGHGQDHDSVGLFQQRPSSGWGSVEECMDVEYSTTVFYKSLKRVTGWEKMDLTVAAQSVQVSAFPDHYAKWEGLAWDIIDEVNK